MERQWEEVASAMETASKVICARLELFQRSAPSHVVGGLFPRWLRVLADADTFVSPDIKPDKTGLRADLMVASTRCLEAWKLDPSAGNRAFGVWASPEKVDQMYLMIEEDFVTFQASLHPDLDVRQAMVRKETLELERHMIDGAKATVREHNEIMYMIRQPDRKEELDEFLDSVQFFVFSGELCNYLQGLSCPIGTRVYISQVVIDRASRGILVNQLIEIAAHELCHNWARWKVKEPQMISPEKNPLIRTSAGEMVEAGDFFEERVFGKVMENPHPFCLNKKVRRIKY